MEFGEFESPFGNLPAPIVKKIIDFLPFDNKKTCRSVCHGWNYIVGNLCNKIKFRITLDNASLVHFMKSNQIFDVVHMRGLTKRLPGMSHSENNFPNIKNVNIYSNNSRAAIMNMFKNGLKYTKTLCISQNTFQFVRRSVISGNIRDFKWDNLMKLELTVYVIENRNHFQSSSTFLKFVKIPYLRQFDLYFNDVYDINNQKIQIKLLFLNIYIFLANHSQSLMELYFKMQYNLNSKPRLQIPTIEDSKADGSIGSNMNIQICKLDLFGEVEGLGFEYLISPSVIGSNLKNLSIIIVIPDHIENREIHFDKYRPVFEANIHSLETVTINADTTVNLFWMNECLLLKSLFLHVKDLVLPTKCVFSHPLTLKIKSQGTGSFPYHQFVVQVGKKIEHLTVVIRKNRSMDDSWVWLNSCTALMYLSLRVPIQLILSMKNVTLPNLIEFHGCFRAYYDNTPVTHSPIDNWTWIKQSMPNLKILKLNGRDRMISLAGLQIVFTLNKLIKIYFDVKANHHENLRSDEKLRIIKHCEDTPGLYFKLVHIPGAYSYNEPVNLIQIDRSIYNITS